MIENFEHNYCSKFDSFKDLSDKKRVKLFCLTTFIYLKRCKDLTQIL